jgi:hypothetical protein
MNRCTRPPLITDWHTCGSHERAKTIWLACATGLMCLFALLLWVTAP